MSVLRRIFHRTLRIRNLLTLTLIVFVVYVFKWFGSINTESSIGLMSNPFKIGPPYFVPKSLKKIDWHNYTHIAFEKKRQGFGEQGLPAKLRPSDKKLEDDLYAVNGFNGALSDKIALNRSVPDIRHPKCQTRLYIKSLPSVSVVVPFHNEHWSTLLRTAWSVIIRSPPSLIKEVFLVDDASTKEFLKKDLDDYLRVYLPKVKVVRLAQRSGLITARLAGAKQATGDVIIFLDSHTEANVNWLPPLLEPIALNYRTVTCPFIDVIAYDTFQYRAQDEGARGAFDWEFFYKRLPILPKDQENMPEPFESPVMAGGLFAISRVFFWELGGYDPGLDIWGGEQYELSFKLWQCGGRMVDCPCSRVGHIYRKFAPFPNPGHGDFVGKNYRRVAEVWMDEYAQYLYNKRPHYKLIPTGDISAQLEIRSKLKCKPFRWFMTQVAFDLTAKYPPIDPPPYAEGHIRPQKRLELCVDMHQGGEQDKLKLTPCEETDQKEQSFQFSWHKDIRSKKRSMCWDLPDSKPRSSILIYSCHLGGGNQKWRYDHNKKRIYQGDSKQKCVDFDPNTLDLYINNCKKSSETQEWVVDTVDENRLADWSKTVERVTGPVEKYEESEEKRNN